MIGIIGTAGRGLDGLRLHKPDFQKMGEIIRDIVHNRLQVQCSDVDLISGGAAWADHLAVHNYINGCGKSLTLALPCKWDGERKQFFDTNTLDWKTNPGQSANKYHRAFSHRVGIDSLNEIDTAISDPRTSVLIGNGFHARNTIIAEKCDALIAFTFGRGCVLKDGGTADTMQKFLDRNGTVGAFHVDLNNYTIYDKPRV